jgi:hypothetical protein
LSKIDFEQAVYFTNKYKIQHSEYITDDYFSIVLESLQNSKIFNKLKENSVVKTHFIKTVKNKFNPYVLHYFKYTI